MKNPTIFKGTLLIFSCVLLTVLGLAILNSDLNADATTTIGLDINTGNITSSGTITSQDLTVQKAGDATLTVYSNTDSPAVDSKLLVVQKGTGTTPTELFSVDEDGDVAIANDLAVAGNITAGTPIATQYGGTGKDWSAVTQGSLPYFSGTGALSNLPSGDAGQFLSQGADGNPEWANVTRSATFVVAASDSSDLSKQQADYVCDGTDDQVQIQAAIDALPSGGGKVVLMEGEYTLDNNTNNALNAAINIGRSNVTLEGSGWGTILKLKDGITAPSILQSYNPTGSNIIVRDLQIDGNKTNTVGPPDHTYGCGFHSSGLTDFIFENLYIHDTWYRGLSFYGANRGFIRNNKIINVHDNGVNLDHNTNYVTVTGNYIDTADYGSGVEIDASTGPICIRNIITNNIVSAYQGIRGVGIGVQECIIANNNIYNSTYGIVFEGKNSIISHNNINNTNNTILKLGGYNNRAIGNTFIHPMNGKIEIAGNYNNLTDNSILGGCCSGILVSGNHNVVRDCIMLRSRDGTGITIEGDYNNIYGNQVLNTGYTNTSLSEAASSGATVINVASVSSLFEGLYILIRETGKSDTYAYIQQIKGNEITLNTALHDSYTTAAYVTIGYHAYWVTGISLASGATGNEIKNNRIYGVATPLSGSGTNTVIQNNIGYTTENSGTATITAGETSATTSHGLATTPTRVQLTPTSDTAGKRYWVSAKDATTFTISIDSSTTTDISFDWRAVVGEGN